ncbi:hypothetical protein [Streptomyces sp. NBC_00076]|jgi:predicted amidophosphoribosyltransferase|uniref:hypothetical protein n=1 Tax=Streptomyces sp. NBC_00076 TaxID=2975642 RepID=UPI00324C36AF|nr:hypothetical protein OG604_00220 [Streptomyces sp. NBC_01231]WSQ15055.1 hypothetical protein OG604_49230 [Streptomyces sp. NBC_01231]WSQ15079.1 hypothetical protein OG604_49365 [Streptomyces sp. NBC_01231]WSQ15282.1 hypothetical protein OG604_50645 [Streptomyces sp. NBC_01231]
MSMPAPPVSEPDPSALTCPGDRVGLCARCQRKTHKYGSGGSPLCQWCMAPVLEQWGTAVRYVSTRT